jgi:hypothetical protein
MLDAEVRYISSLQVKIIYKTRSLKHHIRFRLS